MSDQTSLYPSNPKNVPADLTELNWPYFLRALFVLGTLTVFLALYLGLVAGSGYLCYASFNTLRQPGEFVKTASPKNATKTKVASTKQQQQPNALTRVLRQHIVIAIVVMLASALLFFFLIKGFFKFRQANKQLQVEITEEDQPKFFAFIRQLCKDTGAPMPARVFLVPEVNAAVTYNQTPLSLFLPTSKNLLIGLGLVNRLNLTEFKAVLAHEFGHFSQNSMKLGAYVYQANNIIADMVYGRDFFDDFLERMGQHDMRLDLFAKTVAGIIWTLRKGLEGVFHVINFANSSLCRQMEFNADLVAVTVTGSDAIVHALARLDFANEALDLAFRDLTDASDHKVFSRDVYFHQTKAAEFLKKRDPELGEVPALPDDAQQTTQVFEPGDDGIPLMWKTHPSNFDREQNAKRRYIRGVTDERSPWLLFDNSSALREQLTAQYYQRVFLTPAHKLTDPQAVQAFIDDEHSETTYPERFHGMYDDRFLDLTGWENWVNVDMDMHDRARLQELHTGLYGPQVEALMEKKEDLREDHEELGKLRAKWKSFTFKDQPYSAEDSPRLMENIEHELTAIDKQLGALDKTVFQVHHVMAQQTNANRTEELESRYRFHATAQEIGCKLQETFHAIDQVMADLSGQRQLSEDYFGRIIHFFQEAHLTFKTSLDTAAGLRIPKLKNMTEGQRLGEFLLTEPLISQLPNNTQTLEGTWTERLCKQFGEVLDRMRRIHFKSLGGILALQEQIAAEWAGQEPASTSDEVETTAS